ncbi:catalase family peroxidase [Pseudonocardia xinjiangensis]|uniref:catalase family peroxidase n=1 Tax=Pseudonocardia xinjiangensis TaxID=75289 RepID=UPI003D90FBC1
MPLNRRTVLLGLAAVGGVSAVNVGAFLGAGGWFTPDTLTTSRFVDRFEQVFGKHDGFRRNHAKGVSAAGVFTSNGAGTALSRAALFQRGTTPVTARFSISGGMPTVADANSTVRGLAVLFHLPDGAQWRTAMVNVPVFTDRVPQGFYERLLATQPVPGTGKPDPAKVAAFLAKYPETARAMAVISKTPPSSGLYNSPFHGLNAFRFTNSAGDTVPVRWTMMPEEPSQPMGAGAAPGKDYLFDALVAKVMQGPVRWRFLITVGEPGDPTNDATTAWPANRRQVEVGTLTIDSLQTEAPGNARDVNFDPTVLPDGIALSDDPLLAARSAVYAQSYQRRTREPHRPSEVQVGQQPSGPRITKVDHEQ